MDHRFLALTLATLPTLLPAQGGDPGPAVFAFVESGPPGCAAPGLPREPHFDSAAFPLCQLPVSLCPPLEAAAGGGYPVVLPFVDVPAGAPCFLVGSPVGALAILPPCFLVGHEVLAFAGIAIASNRLTVAVPTPAVIWPLQGVWPLANVQLYALDLAGGALPLIASSRVMRLEARF